MVFYRKYRPQTIAEIDNQAVRESLGRILKNKEVPHAFLLSGPKGTGKTSVARILSKTLNCQEAGIEPCNKCINCTSITSGSCTDLVEIDAASNRGIEEIRELRDKIRLLPMMLKNKIYIIDEVHMLTTEAFNALLKTLEEPPPNVYFVLATTEASKIPQTIVSRCFMLNFKRAKSDEIVRELGRIAKREKLNLDQEEKIFAQIAKAADGSFRDAAKIFERMLLEISPLDLKKASDFLAEGIGENFFGDFTENLVQKKVVKLLRMCQDLESAGVDFKVFLKKLLEFLHEQLLVNYGLAEGEKVFEVPEISALVGLFAKASLEMRESLIPSLPTMLAVVSWCERGEKNV